MHDLFSLYSDKFGNSQCRIEFGQSRLRVGTILPVDGCVLNVLHGHDGPFASHQGIVNFVLAGISVRAVNVSINNAIATTLATAHNNDLYRG